MRRRLATTAFAVLALASAGAFGAARDERGDGSAGASGAGRLGQDLTATAPADPPDASLLAWLSVGSVGATALPRADRGTMITYAYLEREGANPFSHRARGIGSGALPLSELQPAPAATDYALVPGSASPGRASAIPAIAVLFASTLGGLGVLLRRQWMGRREA